MSCCRRLLREEQGQVLYLTLAMFLVLMAFTLVFVNVIYLAAVKIKVQDLADNMALSAATLKARVLNKMTNLNAALEYLALEGGTIHTTKTYATLVEMLAAQSIMIGVYTTSVALAEKHNQSLQGLLERIARENGLEEERGRVQVYAANIEPPYPWNALKSDIALNLEDLYFLPTPTSPPVPLYFPLVSLSPAHDWSVQTRVEWRTQGEIIGGRSLGVRLPDIVARARSEFYDEPVPGVAFGNQWRVRLVQPRQDVDDKLRSQAGTPPAASAPAPSAPAPGDSGTYAGQYPPPDEEVVAAPEPVRKPPVGRSGK